MILFIRTKDDVTVAEVSFYIKHDYLEASGYVDIHEFAKLLSCSDKPEKLTEDMQAINDIRGWLWEKYFMGKQNTKDAYDSVLNALRTILKDVASEHNLTYVED